MRRILLIAPRFPWPTFDGGRIRVFETLRHLKERGHCVTLVTAVRAIDGDPGANPITDICERVVTATRSDTLPAIGGRLASGIVRRRPFIQSFFYDSRLAAHIRDLTSAVDYDIIHIEYPMTAAYLRAVSKSCRARKVLSTHNIESIRFDRETRFSQWDSRRVLLLMDQLFFRHWERDAIRRFDGATAVSEPELQWMKTNAPGIQTALVPNGVDTQYFAYSGACPGANLTFVGSMDYPSNIDAARWFADEILPRLRESDPNIRFRVVGSRPDAAVLALAQRPGIEVTGQVPDIRPYLRDSLAMVVPLRSGGGTRLKILQAMAMGCPVISSTIGAEGLDAHPGRHFLPADSVDEWESQVSVLSASRPLAESLSKSGRELVEEKYEWRSCLKGLDTLYESLMEAKA